MGYLTLCTHWAHLCAHVTLPRYATGTFRSEGGSLSIESRPHISTYLKGGKRTVLVASDREFDQGLLNTKLSLQREEQTATSFHLMLDL